jgi:hypothetical protein
MLRSWKAMLFAYFADLYLLPIFFSQNQTPADVLKSPYGDGFLFRSYECLRDLIPSENATDLPYSFERKGGDLWVSGGVDAIYIVRMAQKIGITFSNVSRVSFTDVTTKILSSGQIEQALVKEPMQPCRKRILDILKGNPGDNIERGVPWILEEVLYGKQRTSFQAEKHLDGGSRVEFSNHLHATYAELDATLTDDAMGTVVTVTSQRSPIAWRPAFISRWHYERLVRFRERGFLKRCASWLGAPLDTAQTILRELRQAFPEDIVPSDRIVKRMSEGEAMPFDRYNQDHRDYLRNVDLLFAASWESYW